MRFFTSLTFHSEWHDCHSEPRPMVEQEESPALYRKRFFGVSPSEWHTFGQGILHSAYAAFRMTLHRKGCTLCGESSDAPRIKTRYLWMKKICRNKKSAAPMTGAALFYLEGILETEWKIETQIFQFIFGLFSRRKYLTDNITHATDIFHIIITQIIGIHR